MNIGYLPTFEVRGVPSNISAGTAEPRLRPTAMTPVRPSKTHGTRPPIYGSSHVDPDHQ